MEQFRAGEQIRVLISRRGKLTQVDALLAADAGKRWTLEVIPDATPEQRKQLNAWLGQPQEP
jgi:predicted metalloprotease with PDZ domain